MMALAVALSLVTEAAEVRRDQWKEGARVARHGEPLDTYELLDGILTSDHEERAAIAKSQTEALEVLERFYWHVVENREHYDELLRGLEGKTT